MEKRKVGNKGARSGKSGRGSMDKRKTMRRDNDSARPDGRRSAGGYRPSRMAIPKGTDIDYKNIAFLQKCLTERGKIVSRRLTSASASQQRLIATAVRRARFLGLLPVGSSRRK